MKKPLDYTKGLIYKICCNDENIKDIYIGSTVDFKSRKLRHKSNCYNEKAKEYNFKLYKFIRDNGEWENWTMIELYKYPCVNKNELSQEEDRVMMELKSSLNSQRAFRTEEEKKASSKKYRDDNRETIKKYNIEYRDDNRETINKQKTEYRANNRETIRKRNAEYRAKNKETISMRKKEKIECVNCGCMVVRPYISKHMKSNKCISHNKPPIEIKI
jgi:hypothetical protein